MNIDEAIAHAMEVAERQEYLSTQSIFLKAREKCAECAADHRQLAEWLTELKEAKRLLKVFVSEYDGCDTFPNRDAVLKLIGEDEDDI